MTIEEAIHARHSVRAYTDKPIEPEKVAALQALVADCNGAAAPQENAVPLHIQLVLNDPKAFGSRLAHYGKFAGVSNYFAMIGPKSRDLDERLGYQGERLVLRAQQLGLNTCWVGLTYKKNPAVLHVADGERLRCVIALGYGATQGVAHRVKPMEKVSKIIVPPGTVAAAPQWFTRGVEAALLAPTAVNQQKFRFTLLSAGEHGLPRVKAEAGLGFFSKVDLGIVKLHFELGAGRGAFEWA